MIGNKFNNAPWPVGSFLTKRYNRAVVERDRDREQQLVRADIMIFSVCCIRLARPSMRMLYLFVKKLPTGQLWAVQSVITLDFADNDERGTAPL